jgi:hypothetical protein
MIPLYAKIISLLLIGISEHSPAIQGCYKAYSAVILASGSKAAVFSKNDIAALSNGEINDTLTCH